jgi:hypothetical protein
VTLKSKKKNSKTPRKMVKNMKFLKRKNGHGIQNTNPTTPEVPNAQETKEKK